MGVNYSQSPRFIFISDANISLEFLKILIYQHLGLLENQCQIKFQVKIDIGENDTIYFSPILISDDHKLSATIEQIIRGKISMIELFVDIIFHFSSNAYVPTDENLLGSSIQTN